ERLVHVYAARLSPEETVEVDGLSVTSLTRTIADLARTQSFESAVIAADAALARQLVSPTELDAAMVRCKGWPGAPRARRAGESGDARREGAGEPRSRVALDRPGLPPPLLQWEAWDVGGRLIGRVDFAWPERRVVGEFDGRLKYGRLVPAGQLPGDVVF